MYIIPKINILKGLILVALIVTYISVTAGESRARGDVSLTAVEASNRIPDIDHIPEPNKMVDDPPSEPIPEQEKPVRSEPKPAKLHPKCDNSPKLAKNPEYIQMTLKIAGNYGVDPHLAYTLVNFESGFNPRACNKKSSARGMMQFLKGTWRDFCKGDVFDPVANLNCGMRLISEGGISHWLADKRVERELISKNALLQ